MSLYNSLFGVNPATTVLLGIIGLELSDIPRFRDVYIDGNNIVVYTRTGGGNREYYEEPCEDNPDGPWNLTLQSNPNYLSDTDDDFDYTYAHFSFSCPEEFKDIFEAVKNGMPETAPQEKWNKLFEKLNGGTR